MRGQIDESRQRADEWKAVADRFASQAELLAVRRSWWPWRRSKDVNERTRLRERIKDVKRHLAQQSVYGGGRRPFGFDVVDKRAEAETKNVRLQPTAMGV
jgi:hypothetical protein